MKKLLLTSVLACLSATTYANCNYDQIAGDAYRVTETTGKYMSNSFVLSEKTSTFTHSLSNKNYLDFVNTDLKVLKTNVPTKYTQDFYKLKTRNIAIGGKPYKRNLAGTTEFVTPSCKTIYYKDNLPSVDFRKADGSKLTDQDVLHIFGKSLTPITIKARSKYDEFDGMYSLSTDLFNDYYLLRGNYSKRTGKLVVLQIYLINKSVTGWMHFSAARDTNGNSYDISKIDSDADCSLSSMGLPCTSIETVGINISEELLRKNQRDLN
ncbi:MULTISPECIES: hypothetical protein [unclassified Moraxella]|uniref:hypothetical protein n=1 Tax=unclassified Moraxella TaxID=2685852 RepID=UPI002B40239B|nr:MULTISPECIES: hypothetical protein [unclassified Moraxella]